jgi:peptidylprolyl isomerase
VDIKEIVTGTGAEAHAPESVTVNYVGVLYKGGAEFDSSWRRGKRFTFTLGTNQVISGWDEGVSGMKVGGRRELIVPASFAYGANGLATQPTAIPPNEALVFVVDLLSA